MTFDIALFRAEFARRMAAVTAYIGELDVVAAELRRQVAIFPSSVA